MEITSYKVSFSFLFLGSIKPTKRLAARRDTSLYGLHQLENGRLEERKRVKVISCLNLGFKEMTRIARILRGFLEVFCIVG